jgi:Uma2 family endonuclease
MTTTSQATIEDLYHVPDNGNAEIVNGELILMAPTGFWPSRAASEIYSSLRQHERLARAGCVLRERFVFGMWTYSIQI